MLMGLCRRPLKFCFGFGFEYGDEPDELLWHGAKLKGHAFGEYSMAVVQANSMLEDQAQILSSPSATFIGVFDGLLAFLTAMAAPPPPASSTPTSSLSFLSLLLSKVGCPLMLCGKHTTKLKKAFCN